MKDDDMKTFVGLFLFTYLYTCSLHWGVNFEQMADSADMSPDLINPVITLYLVALLKDMSKNKPYFYCYITQYSVLNVSRDELSSNFGYLDKIVNKLNWIVDNW